MTPETSLDGIPGIIGARVHLGESAGHPVIVVGVFDELLEKLITGDLALEAAGAVPGTIHGGVHRRRFLDARVDTLESGVTVVIGRP